MNVTDPVTIKKYAAKKCTIEEFMEVADSNHKMKAKNGKKPKFEDIHFGTDASKSAREMWNAFDD